MTWVIRLTFPLAGGTVVDTKSGCIAGQSKCGGKGTSGYGNNVVIRAGDPFYLYGHLDSVSVAKGSHVSSGETIGQQGNTGSIKSCRGRQDQAMIMGLTSTMRLEHAPDFK